MDFQIVLKLSMFVLPLGGLAGVEGDESHRTFAPLGVSTSYNSDLQNIGVGNQLLLNGQTGRVLGLTVRVWKVGGICRVPLLRK